MRRYLLNRHFVFALAVWAAAISIGPSNAFAFPSNSLSVSAPASLRDAQISQIMTALSGPQAQLHLRLSGIDNKDLRQALSKMDDAQLSQVARRADNVKAGGDGVGFVIAILIVVLLIVVIMKLMDKRIEVH